MAIPAIAPYSMPLASALPKNRVLWQVHPQRAVLLIHDMQQYFLNAYVPGESPLMELLANIRLLKNQCAAMEIPAVYTVQPGAQTPEDRGLLQDFWGTGLADEPGQTKVADGVMPGENDTVLTKWRYSAFKRTQLLEFMHQRGRDQLIIGGVYAHIGCLLTAGDAFMQDLEPFLIGDAVADFSAEHHQMALQYAADNCAVVTGTTLLLQELKRNQQSTEKAVPEGSAQQFTLQLMRQHVAELLGESGADIDDNEDLIDRGLDSIRMMSLVEQWRSMGVEATFMKLAKKPTISGWWELLAPK